MSLYQDTIRKHLNGRAYDPRHIEAFMRLQYSTLDHLSAETFKHEVEVGVMYVITDGTKNAESLARTFGL